MDCTVVSPHVMTHATTRSQRRLATWCVTGRSPFGRLTASGRPTAATRTRPIPWARKRTAGNSRGCTDRAQVTRRNATFVTVLLTISRSAHAVGTTASSWAATVVVRKFTVATHRIGLITNVVITRIACITTVEAASFKRYQIATRARPCRRATRFWSRTTCG